MIQLDFLIFQNSYLVFFIFQNRQMILRIQTHKCISTFIYKFIATAKAAFYTLHTDYNPQNICFESPFKNVDNEASESSGKPLVAQKVKHLPAMQKRRRQWHPTPVLLPRKSHGRRSLVGCSPWGRYSRTWLRDFTFTFHFHALEKETATHSSVLAWRIPGTGSLVGCHLWGRTESDTTEATQQQQQCRRPGFNP